MKTPTTILIAALSILAFASPSINATLQLDFARVAEGQWWRMLTGHATHFGASHLFWDLLMFVILGTICEWRHPRTFAISLATMATVISLAIHFACPDIDIYRGLSGLDTGLFAWLLVDEVAYAWKRRDRNWLAACVAAGVILTGKLVFEAVTGQTLFVASGDFRPLVESHLAGDWRESSPPLQGSVASQRRARVLACLGNASSRQRCNVKRT
ncbi:MAG: rhombosortase [Pirellulaceae bacterium]